VLARQQLAGLELTRLELTWLELTRLAAPVTPGLEWISMRASAPLT
jgi:hypothetical protein